MSKLSDPVFFMRIHQLQAIARAAVKFVDVQGARVSIERGHTIGQAEDFAGEQFAELVRTVEAAGR